jgi:hypothetical protein
VYRRHPEDASNAQAHVSRLEKILGQTYPTPPEIAQYCFDDSEMGSCRLPQDTGREPERELSAAFGSCDGAHLPINSMLIRWL